MDVGDHKNKETDEAVGANDVTAYTIDSPTSTADVVTVPNNDEQPVVNILIDSYENESVDEKSQEKAVLDEH